MVIKTNDYQEELSVGVTQRTTLSNREFELEKELAIGANGSVKELMKLKLGIKGGSICVKHKQNKWLKLQWDACHVSCT
jgi:hypothetical protein